ncbi:methyltransferase [Lithospermum erythrorhizon]|uniref:Methyltransferase n=1 Tax=Lithospermum erythrorhizon TaxID=34254 RepID=A0AAV3RXV3_LITER
MSPKGIGRTLKPEGDFENGIDDPSMPAINEMAIPKQNKTFDIYAIEADKHFHDQYKYKKGVTLLPYAAWVRNESLFLEINQDPGDKSVVKGRGMRRVEPVQSSTGSTASHVNESVVSEKDFVVLKMDVEGTEFDLIPLLIITNWLFETRAICLIEEIFLECHYNKCQKCFPSERYPKYENTYGECLDIFTSHRDSEVLVHQWW